MKTVRYLFGLFIMLITIGSSAQEEELTARLEGKTTYEEVAQTIEDFINEMPEGYKKQKKGKHFARWAFYYSKYLTSDGEIADIPQRTIELIKNKQESTRISTGGWTFIGPNASENDNIHAHYNGIGRVDRLAFHPTNENIIYIGTPNGGIWKTTNGGNSWIPLSNYIPSLGVSGIVVDHSNSNRIYVLTGAGDNAISSGDRYFNRSAGVLVSHDGGDSWEQTGELSANPYNGLRLIQSPEDPDVLIAATTEGIYKTRNAGESWFQVKAGWHSDIDFKPGDATTVYASSKSGFYYSTDTANNWQQANFNHALCNKRNEFAVSPANPNVVYLIAGGMTGDHTFCGFFKSIDSGRNFIRYTTSPNLIGQEGGGGNDQSNYDLCIAASPTTENLVYTGALIVWKTDECYVFDNISSYNESGADWYIHPDIHDLAINPLNGILYAATDGGVYSTSNGGISWNDHKDGIATTQTYHLDDYNDDNYTLLIGSHDNGVKYRNTDSDYFSNVGSGDGFDVAINYSDPTKGFAVLNTNVIKYSHFINNSWQDIKTIRWFPQIEINSSDPERVYFADDSVYTEKNGTQTLLGDGKINGYNALKTCPSNSNRIYAAAGTGWRIFKGKFYISNDAGASWDTISNNPGFPNMVGQPMTDIGVNPTNSSNVYIVFGGYEGGKKVYYSSNAGANWHNYSFDLPNVPLWCIEVDSDGNLYVGTDIGVFFKSITSNNWEPFYNGLPNVPVSDLAINESEFQIIASTWGRGLYKSGLKTNCQPSEVWTVPLAGRKFFTASNSITTTSTIEGGAGTEVIMRAGDQVNLYPGFEATEGNKFLAYNGDCDDGLPPELRMPGLAVMPDTLKQFTKKINGHKGTIEILDNSSIRLRQFEKGETLIVLSDETGEKLQTIANGSHTEGIYEYPIRVEEAENGFYTVYLMINDQITHIQEFTIDKINN